MPGVPFLQIAGLEAGYRVGADTGGGKSEVPAPGALRQAACFLPAMAWTSAAPSSFPPMPQSPCSISLIRTQVT